MPQVIAPVVVGLIPGPMAESQLRRALSISLGDPMRLLQSPISATLLAIAALVLPIVLKGSQYSAAPGNDGCAFLIRDQGSAI